MNKRRRAPRLEAELEGYYKACARAIITPGSACGLGAVPAREGSAAPMHFPLPLP